MPFQEYKCQDCGHEYKRLYFAGEKVENPQCPKCGNPAPKRAVSCQPPAEPSPFLGPKDQIKGCGPSSGFS